MLPEENVSVKTYTTVLAFNDIEEISDLLMEQSKICGERSLVIIRISNIVLWTCLRSLVMIRNLRTKRSYRSRFYRRFSESNSYSALRYSRRFLSHYGKKYEHISDRVRASSLNPNIKGVDHVQLTKKVGRNRSLFHGYWNF